MSAHLRRQIGKLNTAIVELGEMAEHAVRNAMRAVRMRDVELAGRVIAGDEAIDRREVEIEEECLHTLALHQPVAMDLRYVIAVLKINNDLERIADMAVNMAEQAIFLSEQEPLDIGEFNLIDMSQVTESMLHDSFDSLVNLDEKLAESVRGRDDQVDAYHKQMFDLVMDRVCTTPERFELGLNILNLSRQLERIADHAVNISEDVIYMVEGEITRHDRPHPFWEREEQAAS